MPRATREMMAGEVEEYRPPLIIEHDADRANAPIFGDDADTENAWQQWRDDLKSAEAKGKIRVAKVPMLDDGTPNLGTKSQVQLMAVPHDQYALDELLEIVRMKFMKPGEKACIRLTGMRTSGGHAGVVPFNRLMVVQRADETAAPGSESQLGEVLKQFREAQNSQAELLRGLLETRVPGNSSTKPVSESVKEWAAILTPLLVPIVTAVIARPKPQSDITQMIGALAQLKGLTSNESNDESDSGITGIVKAVAPAGLQLLNTLAQNQRAPARPVQVRQIPQAKPVVETPSPTSQMTNPNVVPQALTAENKERIEAMFTQLKPILADFATQAASNADAKEVAKLAMTLLPEEYDESLYELVSDPEVFARLKLIEPRMAEHPAWWEVLRTAILSEYEVETADGGKITPAEPDNVSHIDGSVTR